MSTNLVIIGSGGDARETADIAEASNRAGTSDYNILGFIVERKHGEPGTIIGGLPILGDFDWLAGRAGKVVAVGGVGSPPLRHRLVGLAARHGIEFANVIHPSTQIVPSVKLGKGVVIAAGCFLTSQARLGNHTHVNVACNIPHDNVMDDFATLSAGVRLAGKVHLQLGCYVGLGAMVLEGKRVGKWSVVGAGSMVHRDVPDRVTVTGNPARILYKRLPRNWIMDAGEEDYVLPDTIES